MPSYRVCIPQASDALTDRLLRSGWRMLSFGSGEWLVVGESDEQVRAELSRVLPDRRDMEIEELAAGYTISVGLG